MNSNSINLHTSRAMFAGSLRSAFIAIGLFVISVATVFAGGGSNDSGPTVQFSDSRFHAREGDGFITVKVTLIGAISQAVTVDYSSGVDDDGTDTAKQRTDFILSKGTLTFAPGDTFKTFIILITQDSFVEGQEEAKIILSNPSTGLSLGNPNRVSLELEDDDIPGADNSPIDDNRNFVRQQYHDFLNREPDAGGWGYWTEKLDRCGTDTLCINRERRDVSAAFYISREFQETGYFVFLLEKAGFNRRPQYNGFMPDVQRVGRESISLSPDSARQRFSDDFSGRPEFHQKYGAMTNAAYVNDLYRNSEIIPDDTARNRQIDDLNNNRRGRGQILREIVERQDVHDKHYNAGFVLIEYYGYLRRESDEGGYQFWLNMLNNREPNNVQGMVCSFVTSREYQERFGTKASHSNEECRSIQ